MEGYPYCKVEIFRGVKYWDDVFNPTKWTLGAEGGSLSTDGKIGTLSIASLQTQASIKRGWSFSAGTYRYAVLKATELTGTKWRLEALLSGVVKAYKEFTDTGLKTVDLQNDGVATPPYTGNIDGIRLLVYGSGGNSVKFDYLKICEKTVLIPADGSTIFDVIDATVYLAVTEEVGSLNLLLQNFAAAYTDKISVGDLIEIAMTRGSDPYYKVMKGRIESVTKIGEATIRGLQHYLRLKGRDLGAELFNRLVTKRYENKEGSVIVKDVLANFTDLESIGVEATYSTYVEEEYENKPAWEIIKYIAETAQNASGIIGYDFKCEEGDLKFYERGKYSSGVSLTDLITLIEFETAIERVRNRIYVYGEASKPYPLDRDAWTESLTPQIKSDLTADAASGQKIVKVQDASKFSVGDKVLIVDNNGNEDNEVEAVNTTTNEITMKNNLTRTYTVAAKAFVNKCPGWLSGTGSGSISGDSVNKIVGSYSVKHNTGAADYYGCAWFDLHKDNAIDCNKYPSLTFQIMVESAFSGHISLALWDDADMKVYQEFHISGNKWHLQTFPCGRKWSDQWTHSLFNTQPFNWEKVKRILFYAHFPGTGTGNFWIDNLFFDKCRWSGTAQDVDSQAKYGIRELAITDENLVSDDACAKVAAAELKHRKDPAKYLRITILGDPRIKAGEMIYVVSENEAISDQYRIQAVEHWMNDEGEFESRLTLIAEPPRVATILAETREEMGTLMRGTAYRKLGK